MTPSDGQSVMHDLKTTGASARVIFRAFVLALSTRAEAANTPHVSDGQAVAMP
jgi:hypothetical protein